MIAPPAALVKPRLRGVSHTYAAVVAAGLGGLLMARVAAGDARRAVLVYTLSLVTLFGVSAAYHRPTWSPVARQWMRRLDHAAIFVLIAGTYTALCLGLPPADASTLRTFVWVGALLGVLQSVLWVTAPKPLIAVLYVALGWSIAPYMKTVYASVGGAPLALVLVGGVAYSAGAVVYAKKRPDPVPAVFGYHEVFHALVIVAAALHFAAVAIIALGVSAGG